MTSRRANLLACAVAAVLLVGLIGGRLALRELPLERLSRTELQAERSRYSGSWSFPRGGPYVLGFDSPSGQAVLRIDGRVVAQGRGQVAKRIVYRPGVVAVELDAPEGARLLWHPPGRRGPLEYVLASSLSPKAPEEAEFGPWSGAAPLDAAVAVMVLMVLLGLLVFVSRRALGEVPREVWLACAAVFILALIARLIDLGGAGATWDEDVNWSAGRNYIINLLELDFARESWRWNYEHPPMMKYIAGIGALMADGYGPARALSAIVLAGACALVVVVARRLFDLPTGILAGLIVALSPHLIGHGKIVGHEAPTVLWWTAAVWASLRIADVGPKQSDLIRKLAVVGVVVGVAVFSRFVNVLLLPLVGFVLLVYVPRERRRALCVASAIILPLAVLVVGYICWPRLWTDPFGGMQEAWIKLRKPHGAEFFLGHYTNVPARHYFAVYLGAATPLGVLLLALGWFALAMKRRTRGDLVIFAWIAVPLLVALSPVRQDGVRYIMPSLVGVSLAAAAFTREAARWLSDRQSHFRPAFPVLAAAITGYLAITAWRIHPYYIDYYGEHVGGTQGVARSKSFEIAWWGEGLDRAVAYINANAAEGARVYKACVAPSHLTWMRHDLWAREARRPDRAEWLLVYQPYTGRCPIPGDAKLVYQVEVSGAALAQVYRRGS